MMPAATCSAAVEVAPASTGCAPAAAVSEAPALPAASGLVEWSSWRPCRASASPAGAGAAATNMRLLAVVILWRQQNRTAEVTVSGWSPSCHDDSANFPHWVDQSIGSGRTVLSWQNRHALAHTHHASRAGVELLMLLMLRDVPAARKRDDPVQHTTHITCCCADHRYPTMVSSTAAAACTAHPKGALYS